MANSSAAKMIIKQKMKDRGVLTKVQDLSAYKNVMPKKPKVIQIKAVKKPRVKSRNETYEENMNRAHKNTKVHGIGVGP